ncbi:hypothetical protein CGRA01v4_02221 [Colletotrichum graminicola]|uniref:Uncharacterized protein n=1 Tax=Colletotrichum graminicola (strain M1.001 / M2 / FGSC 10212) TaxID=645133 RepID=E3Q3V4_COLGM|nr:uncharacterized protein GLRG_00850 [Colletotrichum graminicola M1.001]EFQ25706.1 hypothetical protein GLRG_00850 [Colletotrichum graminicola M1.001]WDK10942.1 hypothetical protein CGRA01v4_02221 [Colletotrichum graminicola]
MHLSTFFTALIAAAPLVVKASPLSIVDGNEYGPQDIEERAMFPRIKTKVFLSLLPDDVKFTVNEIKMDKPDGSQAWREGGPAVPFTIATSEVTAAIAKKWRGVYLGELAMQKDKAGEGSSFHIKYTISSPSSAAKVVSGTLTIGSTTWGAVSRPDHITYSWQLGDSGWGTWTSEVLGLSSPDDTFITVGYVPEKQIYAFGLTTKTDAITKFLGSVVRGIINFHTIALSAGSSSLGTVASVGIKVALAGASKL